MVLRLGGLVAVLGLLAGCQAEDPPCTRGLTGPTGDYHQALSSRDEALLRARALALREALAACPPADRNEVVVPLPWGHAWLFNELAVNALSPDLVDAEGLSRGQQEDLLVHAAAFGDVHTLRALLAMGFPEPREDGDRYRLLGSVVGGAFDTVEKLSLLVDSGVAAPPPKELRRWADHAADEGEAEVAAFLASLADERDGAAPR